VIHQPEYSASYPSHNGREGLYYAPKSLGWRLKDIDWKFVFTAQHYGTIIWGILIAISLAISHWVQKPAIRPFLNYDASISYTNTLGDKVPSAAAVLAPFGILIITLVFYEFIVFRFQNKTITHALATFVHFLADALCCFVTCVFITEVTKFGAGRLRPDFLQSCGPQGGLQGQAAALSFATAANTPPCLDNNLDSRKSFPSGHASSSAVTMVYSIVYNLWSGYFRCHDASFMGLNRATGWRGGHRFLREFGHGAYLVWNLAQFGFFWAVGVTRFTDNKHNISDVIGGWYLGTVVAVIYSLRAVAIHKYVALDMQPVQRQTIDPTA
jgi:membrane-associated phospholipid phosphatase